MVRYAKPATLNAALDLLGEGSWRIFAGGTDFYPAQGVKPLRDDVLDINGLDELRAIGETADHFVFGARTTWTDIVRHALPPAFDALKQAAVEVGSIQIQNCGTLAGNLCNASPAADGVPALMVLDAEVELRSRATLRHVAIQDFILGNRKTVLTPGEMVTGVRIPKQATRGHSAFLKLGARRYLVISIAMVAARIGADIDGRVVEAAIAIGACSPVAQRLHALEVELLGQTADADLGRLVQAAHLEGLTPIDDVRASAAYRLEAARVIVARTINAAIKPMRASAQMAAA